MPPPPAAKLPDGGTIQHWYDGTTYKVIGADGAVDDVEVTTTVLPGGGLHFEVDSLAGTVIYTVPVRNWANISTKLDSNDAYFAE